jgi:hypothetical protein
MVLALIAGAAVPASSQEALDSGAPESSVTVGEIQRLYRTVLGRDAEDEGLIYWTGVANSGARYDDFTWAFVASDEWAAAVGNGLPDADFVNRLYQQALGRPSDPAGFSYWVDDILGGGAEQRSIIRWFAESEEQMNATEPVIPLYLVGRTSDGFAFDSAFEHINGANVCVVAFTAQEATISELAFGLARLSVTLNGFEDEAQMIDAFKAGICDVVASDGSGSVLEKASANEEWVRFPRAPLALN